MAQFQLESLGVDLCATLDGLKKCRLVERIWAKDHTAWSRHPVEIANRLGWLDLARKAASDEPMFSGLIKEVKDAGIRDVVLLGMGGSSLGAEALRKCFGPQHEFPRLHVVDSTHPSWARRVRQNIDLASTFFVVATKSGTTAEVISLFHYFWAEVEQKLGKGSGHNFVAITDPGTPLEVGAARRGFLQTFLNPPDIGGRFSVLSNFGFVPAAAAGIDPARLLASGRAMAQRCLPSRPLEENPGIRLGAALGAAALAGRDQMTLLTSKRIASFGLWVEQLVAESTGKEGRGILPVIGEPWADYGENRLFVAIRYAAEPDSELDDHIESLKSAGQPVVEYELQDLYDLGGEFFRWEFATAVAGHLLEINPFNQPDVEVTKLETRRILDAYAVSGELPAVNVSSDLTAMLREEARPRYVALMAYAASSPELEHAVDSLRRCLLEDFGLTTTFGYGPRFLHSTGQFHKGGPDGGLFVQLMTGHGTEIQIPGKSYGLGLLLQAQAAGDLAALQAKGRRCVRIDLGDDPAGGVGQILERLR